MPGGTNSLSDVKKWQDRIRNGLRFQERIGRSNEWARYKGYYRHEFKTGTLPVNVMFSVLRTLTPQVVLRNPRVTITPRKSGIQAELNARIVQKLDNWMLNELMTKRELKKIVQDCFFAGTATGFIGYDTMYGFDVDRMDPTGTYTLDQFNQKGDRIETNKGVNPGMPWFLRARPEDVIFPWGSTDAESLEWVAMRVFRRVADLKQDKRYSNTKDLTGTIAPVRSTAEGGISTEWQNAGQYSPDPDAQYVELWQVHSARSGKIHALTLDGSQMLRSDKDEMQIDGLPSETISFNPDPDYIYGVPDARIIEPQLLELMDIRTQAQRHRQRDLLKFICEKNALTPEDKQKLKNGDIGAFAEIDAQGGDIRSKIAPLSPGVAGILNDLNQMGSIVQGDIREMVGMSRVLQGDYQGKTHVSAAETDAVMQSLSIRLDERRDAMADMLGRVIGKWNEYIFTYWTQEKIESIIGPDGARWWMKFTGPEIKDDYNLIVEPEEGQSTNTQSKRQELLQVATAWAQLNQGAIKQGQPVPAEIQRALFSQFDDIGLDVDKLIAQAAAGNQQTQMQMAMQGQGGMPGQGMPPQGGLPNGMGSQQQPINPAMLATVMRQRQGGGM
jgi:hypothetical protein